MAQERAAQPFYDFMYPHFLLKDLFDITMHEDDYLERAYNVWRDIGNIAIATHAFEFEIGNDQTVVLPCNVEFVEAVSSSEYWRDNNEQIVNLFHTDVNMNPNQFLADSIVRNPNFVRLDNQQSQLHPEGEYLPYELRGTTGYLQLHFDSKFVGQRGICIYRGVCVDEDGNPLLNRKEAEAIAYRMAFLNLQKRVWMGEPMAADIMARMNVSAEAGRKMAAAKIPEYISQNEWNRVLSAQTRHDRKVFWSSYKTMQ